MSEDEGGLRVPEQPLVGPAALTVLDAALTVMRADMSTGKASKRSLGVVYAFLMAGHHCSGPDFWGPINQMIKAYGEKAGVRNQFAFLEGVKKAAWSIFDEVGQKPDLTKGTHPAAQGGPT